MVHTGLVGLLAIGIIQVLASDQVVLQQPEAGEPRQSPSLGPLPWSDLNIVHTTDTHGWLRGHLGHYEPEMSYSGDWGDLYSFVHHMKTKARQEGKDLLVVDSGDLHDGNGLVDADPDVRGSTASVIMARLPYDLMTVGNHELYQYNIALDFHQRFFPLIKDRYLASNVYITLPNQTEPVLFGAPFRKFTTEQGKRILAFGTLFNFTYAAPGVHVQYMNAFVKEPWFLDVLQRERDQTDVVVLLGHLPVGYPEWILLHKTIRRYFADTPILLFGGHAHIRDCEQLDTKSMTLASGRYLETLGWMSLSDPKPDGSVEIERRYLDANKRTYKYHTTSLTDAAFDTKEGVDISNQLQKLASSWNLSYTFGYAPRNYYLTRHPMSVEGSAFNLLINKIFPALIQRPDREQPTPLMILNSGSVRFDISQGPFTKDAQSLCFPFINQNFFIPNVPTKIANQLVDNMNIYGEYHNASLWHAQYGTRLSYVQAAEEAEVVGARAVASKMWQSMAADVDPLRTDKATYGYHTIDTCPGLGDDTQHVPLPYYEPPVFIGTEYNVTADTVDVAFFDFITPFVLDSLNRIQHQRTYTTNDIHLYTNVTSDTILGTYASMYWSNKSQASG